MTCGICSHLYDEGGARVALAPSFKMSGKRRNQRGAGAVCVWSRSAFSWPPARRPPDGGNLKKDVHAPQDDLPTD